MHNWVVWRKSKKGAENICSFELSEKETFSNYDETKSTKMQRKKIQVKVEVRQYQNGNGLGSRLMLGSKDFTVTTKQIRALRTVARVSGGKDECQV